MRSRPVLFRLCRVDKHEILRPTIHRRCIGVTHGEGAVLPLGRLIHSSLSLCAQSHIYTKCYLNAGSLIVFRCGADYQNETGSPCATASNPPQAQKIARNNPAAERSFAKQKTSGRRYSHVSCATIGSPANRGRYGFTSLALAERRSRRKRHYRAALGSPWSASFKRNKAKSSTTAPLAPG